MSEARNVASTVLDAFRDELVVRLVDLCNVNNFDRLTLLKTCDTINEIYDKHIKKWLYADTVDIAPDTKWISVKERLPEVEADILAYIGEGSFVVCWMTHDGYWQCPAYLMDKDDVTHWMPLPELPKEEGEPT